MSEEQEIHTKVPISQNGANLKLEISRSAEMEQLQERNIELEKELVELKLSTGSIPKGDKNTVTWDQNNNGHNFQNVESLPVEMITANSEEELITILQARAKKGDPDAKTAINQLYKKALEKPLNLEFEGASKDLFLSEKPIREHMTNEEKAKASQFNKDLKLKRANWRNLK
jgi:hypothetical protein